MMTTARFTILVASCLMFIASCKVKKIDDSDSSPYTFDFISASSIVQLADIAKSQNKLVFIDVYTDWCLPCKMMDEDVFSDKKLGQYFNDNFVSHKANGESMSGADIAKLYEVLGYPTLLFIDSNGNLLVKKTGVAYSREMYELADEAIAISKRSLGE